MAGSPPKFLISQVWGVGPENTAFLTSLDASGSGNAVREPLLYTVVGDLVDVKLWVLCMKKPDSRGGPSSAHIARSSSPKGICSDLVPLPQVRALEVRICVRGTQCSSFTA